MAGYNITAPQDILICPHCAEPVFVDRLRGDDPERAYFAYCHSGHAWEAGPTHEAALLYFEQGLAVPGIGLG